VVEVNRYAGEVEHQGALASEDALAADGARICLLAVEGISCFRDCDRRVSTEEHRAVLLHGGET